MKKLVSRRELSVFFKVAWSWLTPTGGFTWAVVGIVLVDLEGGFGVRSEGSNIADPIDKKNPDEVVFGRRVEDNTGVCKGVCVHFPTGCGGVFVEDISSMAACASAKADAMAFFGLSPTDSKFVNSIRTFHRKLPAL
jgi:hypothetical protein